MYIVYVYSSIISKTVEFKVLITQKYTILTYRFIYIIVQKIKYTIHHFYLNIPNI